MTAQEIFDTLKSFADKQLMQEFHSRAVTCDVLKAGDLSRTVTHIATAMFGTVDVVRRAKELGAELLIVHEPLCYDHFENDRGLKIQALKRQVLEESGLTVVRYHDHIHRIIPDMIDEGGLLAMGLKGKVEAIPGTGVARVLLDEPMTAMELARLVEDKLHIRHARIAGCTDKPGRLISCAFGTPANREREIEECDFMITGELCEWGECEMLRDYAALGYNKAVLVIGHCGSERAGMELLAKRLPEWFPSVKATYLECGEVFTYTDG